MSKPKTKDECLDEFMRAIRCIVSYWSCQGKTHQGVAEGVAFSILNIIDGMSGSFDCAIDLVMRPHPDDKRFKIDEGDDYIESGTIINDDVYLRELLFKGREEL